MLGINRGIISKICEEREGERGNSIRISQSEIVSRAKATERVGGKRRGEFLSAIGRNKKIARICFPEYFAARDGDERPVASYKWFNFLIQNGKPLGARRPAYR